MPHCGGLRFAVFDCQHFVSRRWKGARQVQLMEEPAAATVMDRGVLSAVRDRESIPVVAPTSVLTKRAWCRDPHKSEAEEVEVLR